MYNCFWEVRMVELKDWVRALYPMHTFLITSIGEKGTNVFTVDWVTVISRKPAIVCVSVSPLRYSHKLIKESGEFIVNVPSMEFLEKVNKCGILSGRDYDKFETLGLEKAPSKMLKTEIVKDCFAFLECKVIDARDYGDHTLFVGAVLASYSKKEFSDSYKPIFHIRGSIYSTMAEEQTKL